MKQELTKFICDDCKKEHLKKQGNGFPYEEDWCFLYNFTGKVLQSHYSGIELNVGRYENKDKHFCSEKCMMTFIKKVIKEARKEPKSEPINIAECVETYKKIKKNSDGKNL